MNVPVKLVGGSQDGETVFVFPIDPPKRLNYQAADRDSLLATEPDEPIHARPRARIETYLLRWRIDASGVPRASYVLDTLLAKAP